MHFIFRHRHNLTRHLPLIEGGEPQGGEGEPPAGQNTNGEGNNAKNTTTGNAKELSHALAARVEEEKAKLEAQYAGYDEYKAKAAKYDANESDNAAKLEAADKRIESLTKEIATLKATAERETLIGQLAKDTGLAETSSPGSKATATNSIDGNAYAYNEEAALPGVAFRGVERALHRVHRHLQPEEREARHPRRRRGRRQVHPAGPRSNVNDQRAEQTTLKVKAISYKYQETFFDNGDTDVDTKSFDGLKKRLAGKQVIDAATNGMPILGDSNADIHKFLDKLDELLAAVPGINPTNGAIYASSAIIRKIGSAMRHISYDTTLQQDIVGKRVMQWNGIPLLEAGQRSAAGKEILDNDEKQGTSSTTTSIYAVKFGASEGDQGVTGLTNGGVQVEDPGQLQEKPAYRTRIEFYCGLRAFSGKAAARLKGVING